MLGDMPGLVSGRSSPNYESVVAPGRQHEAAFERMGEGYREFGRGITNFGKGLQEYGESQYAKEEKLNGAMATANSTIYEDNVKSAIENENDPEKIKQLLGTLDQGYATAGSNLSGDQAKLFALQSQHRANSVRLAGEKRINLLNQQSYMASAENTINDLQTAFAKGDRQTQADALESAGKIFDYMAENGYMTPQKAEENKNLFARGATMSFIANQPVDKQFELLGVSKPGAVAAKDLKPYETAFLNALAGPESAGKYNVRYTPGGGATFNSFADHPRIYEKGPDGPSSAAGRYQFVASTWDKVIPGQFKQGGFTPENQDHAALWYARQVYREKTSGDLDQELQTNGVSDKVVGALGNTWRGLRDNPRKSRSWYGATLQNAPNAEGSYEIASSNPNFPLHPEDHAKLVNNAFAQKKKELELANAQTKMEIEHADEQFYSRLTDNKLDNILEDIQNDPVLRQHPKEQLQMMDIAKRHISAIEKNKGGDYGPGYTEGFDGVMKGDITTPQQLYQMNQEGKLTIHGVQQLKTMMGDLRSKPEKAVEQKVIAGQLAYAKGKLIGPYSFSKNSEGEQLFNSTFVPAFYSRYQAWVKAGKDPYEFLSKENTDKIIKEIKPDALTAAQNRVTDGAGLNDKKPVQTGPETILPPPNGVSIDQKKWNEAMVVRPNAPSGNPISLFNWSSAIRGLVNAPTAKNRQWFNQAFPGANADKILTDLGVPAQ